MDGKQQPLLCIVGQTASGKSAVALEVASELGGTIIAADSMQVYAGMDIATAKPSPEERARIPHRCLDLVHPDESFSVAQWLEHARAALDEAKAASRRPIVVGGTGLYIRSLLRGLAPAPAIPESVLDTVKKMADAEKTELLKRLAPEKWAGIDLQNMRRVDRALALALSEEIPASSRTPQSMATKTWETPDIMPHRMVWLQRETEDLRQRIENRVEAMFAGGIEEEYGRLIASGLRAEHTAWQALGYKEIGSWKNGEINLGEVRRLIQMRTWQYARRQATWFRKEPTATALRVRHDETPAETAERILTPDSDILKSLGKKVGDKEMG